MKKDEFDYIGSLVMVIASISFVRGYMNASAVTPIWSGIGAAFISPFIIVLPSVLVAVFVSALFNGNGLKILNWLAAIFLALFLDLAMKSGSGCNGYEIEDRWGVVRCYEP